MEIENGALSGIGKLVPMGDFGWDLGNTLGRSLQFDPSPTKKCTFFPHRAELALLEGLF